MHGDKITPQIFLKELILGTSNPAPHVLLVTHLCIPDILKGHFFFDTGTGPAFRSRSDIRMYGTVR